MQKWVFLFRHGETDFNREHRFQGHLDIPLNAEGKRQAALLESPLTRLGCEEILSSDLIRAVETAQIATQPLGLKIYTHKGLREAYLGEAQGLTTAEIATQFGESLVAKWRSPFATDADVSYPGGETGKEVLARVLSAMQEHLSVTSANRIGVATHGGVIRRVVRSLLHHKKNHHEIEIPIPNGIIYALCWDPKTGSLSFPGYTPLFER